MDYAAYKKYQTSLPDGLIRLDDVSPYDLFDVIDKIESEYTIAATGQYILYDKGVRSILKKLFARHAAQNHTLVLPSDVYPVYFDLVPEGSNTQVYQTFQQNLLDLPESENAVALITYPLVPEGKYQSISILKQLFDWCTEGKNRWLIIDNVYDLKNRYSEFSTFVGNVCRNRVISVNSLSKIALQPGKQGWAVSSCELDGFDRVSETLTIPTYRKALSSLYSDAWKQLSDLLLNVDKNWLPPQVGYIAVIQKNYQKLLKHNIAALPASVFGLQNDNVSVVSCLGVIKHELL